VETLCGDEAAYALDWADAGVMDQMRYGDPESVTLLYRLLDAPGAVPEVVSYGPMQGPLEDRGPEVEQDIVRLCASEPTWRQAVAEVVLPDEQHAAVPALLPYRV